MNGCLLAVETESILFTAPLDGFSEQGSRNGLRGWISSVTDFFCARVCSRGLLFSEFSVSLRSEFLPCC